MKKILSLLVLLVTTLSAFALDFTDYRKVTLGSYTPTESNDAKLSVTDNGDGTYNVTFNDIINKDGSYTDNYGTFTFSNVSGSKSGDVTTVTATDVTGTVSGGTYNITEFTKGNLSLKFKDGKAYATMTATCRVFYSNYTFDVVFGTDEGFDGGSTGGGETGGETSSIVTVKENFQSTEGSSWGENITIDWNTQKLVVSVNLASTGSDKGFLGVTKKGQTAGWNNYGIIFYNTNGSTVQGYAPGQPNNANTNQVTKGEDPVRFEISKDGGVKCQGNVVISASNIAHLTNQSEIVVGAADKPAGALYNYIKVVPLNWTEVPPVTVAETFTYDQDAFVGPNDTKGTANVKVYKMTDDSYTMEITAPVATKVGVITVGEDAKGRTTYMGEVESSVVSGVKYVVNGVVYEEGGAKHLYMTLTHDDDTYIIGENPDAPKVVSTLPFENVAYTTSMGGNGTATVTFTEMSDDTFPMTFVSDDLNVKAENLTKGTDEKGRTTYTGTAKRTDVDVTFTVKAVVYEKDNTARLYMTMITGVTTVVVGENPDAVTPEVTEVSNKTYTSNLRILDGETTVVEEAEANVNIVKYSDESYKVTLKNVNMLNKTQDLVFVGTGLVEEGPAEGVQPLTIIAKSDEATTTVFGEQVSGTFEITEVSADEIKMGFSMESQNFSYQGEFNYTDEEVVEPEVYTSNLHIYDAAAPETDLFQTDQAKVEFLATETGEFKLTLKDVTLNEKTQDLVFTGALPTPQPGGQDPLAEEGEGEVTPAEPAMVLNATADEATTNFFGVATYPTAVFNVSYDKNDNFMMTFTIAAGAKNYGGEFNYEKKTPETPDVTVEVEKTFTDSFSLNNVSLGNAKVTIKEMSDKTINMVFTFGTNDFTSTDLVKGTDDKNRTTYTGTISIGGVECVVNGVVYTKDNAEKLYMTLVSTTSGTYVFGTEPTDTPEPPVVEEYPINFDKDANSTHSSRVLNSFSLQQTGKDKQTKSVKTSKAAYEDHTADEPFTVEAGSELTASFDYTGEWMHSFVYIDFDNDGQFSYKEGQWDQTGTDLVAFSFYSLDSNPKNDASGYNSVGDELTGDARNTYAAPSFKAPAKAGEYRIRFKIDWNCILPGGSSSILSDGGGVWDATLKVVEPVVDGISSINAEVANGEAQLFTIDGVKLNKLQKGLNIVRTADGKVKKVLVK